MERVRNLCLKSALTSSLCSQRRMRVQFINKIDSEVAWMTRVLDENFSLRCLTVNLIHVLFNVINRGARYLIEVDRSVTYIFFKRRVILHFSCNVSSTCCLTKLTADHAVGKIVPVKRGFEHNGCSKNLLLPQRVSLKRTSEAAL